MDLNVGCDFKFDFNYFLILNFKLLVEKEKNNIYYLMFQKNINVIFF